VLTHQAGIGNVNNSNYGNGINGFHYCLHMDEQDVSDEVIDAMHKHYWENVLHKKEERIITKQPHLSNKLKYVLGIFPDAKFIHIVRDCQPVVASWVALMNEHPSLSVYWPNDEFPCFWLMPKPETKAAVNNLSRHKRFFPGGGSELWIDYWCKVNLGIEKQMQSNLSQLLVIRYEDLISSPEKVLKTVNDFCEISYFDFDTSHFQLNAEKKHSNRLTPALLNEIQTQSKKVREKFAYLPVSGNLKSAKNLYLP